jgi:hypothetical protein
VLLGEEWRWLGVVELGGVPRLGARNRESPTGVTVGASNARTGSPIPSTFPAAAALWFRAPHALRHSCHLPTIRTATPASTPALVSGCCAHQTTCGVAASMSVTTVPPDVRAVEIAARARLPPAGLGRDDRTSRGADLRCARR